MIGGKQSRPALLLSTVLASILFLLAQGCAVTESHTAYKSYTLDDGMWSGSFAMGFVETRAATIAALTDLKMPVVREERTYHGSYLDTQTSDGYHVRIHFRSPRSQAAGGAPATQVAVRVGGFGTHEGICSNLLDEIGRHLNSVPSLSVSPPSAGPIQVSTVAPPATGVVPAATGIPATPDPSLPPQPVPVGK